MSVKAPDLVAPAYHTVPTHVSSAGAEVADLAAASGFVPDPEQRMILDSMYAEAASGASFSTTGAQRWSALEVGIVCSRQNLKTAVLEMAVLGDMFLLDAQLVIWTAHLFPTAVEAFIDFKRLIDANAHLSRRVKRITEGAGTQGIELMNGARLKFLARSKTSGRGLTGDVIILDEAFALTGIEMGALLPTLSSRPNPQVRYGSSAGRLDSDLLRSIRDRGRVGDPSLAYLEWCSGASCDNPRCLHAVGEPGCVLDDPDEWHKANPALGRRISVEYIASERRALPPGEFARERLGWWDEPNAGNVIPRGKWTDCMGAESIAGPVALFADIAIDRATSVIAVCGATQNGLPQVEIAEMAPGTEWVVERIAQIIESNEVLALGARSAGPVASLLPELRGVAEDANIGFSKVGSGDFAGMCGAFYDAAMIGTLRHRGDPRIENPLNSAKRHKVLDAWSWERIGVDVDAAPLVAATGAFALYAQNSTVYDPLQNIW